MIRNGYHPAWINKVPRQRVRPRNPPVSQAASQVLDNEVQGLLDKGAICEVVLVPGQYVSSYFAVPKSKRTPDKWRPILNLKKFNKGVRHVYFQMEEVKAARNWFQKGSMCAGLDLKQAYLHVPMAPKVRKFLRFEWNGKLYEWQVLPFGLKCSPRVLTKMVKPILRFLTGKGISLTAFIDDFTNQADCECRAIFKIHVIALVFMCCGWSVNWLKTILSPSCTPTHLGLFLEHPGGDYCPTRGQNGQSGAMGTEVDKLWAHHSGGPGEPGVSQGQHGSAAQDGSPIRLPHQEEVVVVHGGDPDALDEEVRGPGFPLKPHQGKDQESVWFRVAPVL